MKTCSLVYPAALILSLSSTFINAQSCFNVSTGKTPDPCLTSCLTSALTAGGLCTPNYLSSFYQCTNAICIGKSVASTAQHSVLGFCQNIVGPAASTPACATTSSNTTTQPLTTAPPPLPTQPTYGNATTTATTAYATGVLPSLSATSTGPATFTGAAVPGSKLDLVSVGVGAGLFAGALACVV